jgi:hypothetical protein
MLCRTQNHKNDCNCTKLQREYGLRLFKCDRPGCSFFRAGFESRKDRDRHVNSHSRPFKCDTTSCDFADLGFATKSGLNAHKKRFHSQISRPSDSVVWTDNTPELKLILVDAVKANDLDCIHKLWSEVPRFLRKLLRTSIRCSSSEMLELLLKVSSDVNQIEPYLVNYAAKCNKPKLLDILLEHGCWLFDMNSRYTKSDLHYAIHHRSPEMIKSLMAHGARDCADGFERLIPNSEDLQGEETAVQCFALLKELITDREHKEACFRRNAQRAFSIPIARILISKGAFIDSRHHPTAFTPLYAAAGHESLKAAEFMKFLLESGADPDRLIRRKPLISERPGPRNISQWFGIEWDDFVRSFSSKRRKLSGDPGSPNTDDDLTIDSDGW